jgi:hypothetical protein
MTRALLAAARSKTIGLIDRLNLEPNEAVHLGIGVAIDYALKAGLDRRGLHALLDDRLATRMVEGEGGRE